MQTQVMDAIDAPSLRAYVCWVPILDEDVQPPDEATQALVSDPRATHFWDVDGALPPVFRAVLGLPEGWPAWDVYLAYPAGARWDRPAPAPSFWQHQLGELPKAPLLDGVAFAVQVREML